MVKCGAGRLFDRECDASAVCGLAEMLFLSPRLHIVCRVRFYAQNRRISFKGSSRLGSITVTHMLSTSALHESQKTPSSSVQLE